MAVFVNNHGDDTAAWQQALQRLMPDMTVYAYPDIPDPDEILYAAVWHHPHEDLLRYKNLKAVLVLGAGTDHIDQAPVLPKVPIVRLIDPAVGNDMAQYVLYWLMHCQRGYQQYHEQQQSKIWQRYEYPLAADYQVTILGAGQIASFIAERIAVNGFKTAVWSRSPRPDSSGVTYHHSEYGLHTALSGARVLVNCLPLKDTTREFINRARFAQLPKGAAFINVSRGAVVHEQDLLTALDEGQLSFAALDTFSAEPLPKDHPFWSHPKVRVTPHMSGATYTRTAAGVIVENIMRVERGEQPFPIYTPPRP